MKLPRRPVLDHRTWWIAGVIVGMAAAVFVACMASTPRAPVAAGGVTPTPNVDATVAATIQGRAQAPAAVTGTPVPSAALDETFTATPKGWPNDPKSTAWYTDATYHLQPRVTHQFVAIDAPPTDAFNHGTVSARFHKTGGPPGGGYGLIIDDQGPEVHDGVYQGGQFVVLEVGDDGTVGAWQRDGDRWIDIVPWTPNRVVHPDTTPNDLEVRSEGHQVTFLVNAAQVAQFTTDLPAGRIGVFVGGDGNQVALERFTAHWPSQTGAAAAVVRTTAVPLPPAKPTVVPTPDADELMAQLDLAWAQGRWSDVQILLDRIQTIAPAALDLSDKRYAAHIAAGQDLLDKGNSTAAADEFEKAQTLDPNRGEANVALILLTPSPTPVPRPQITGEMRAYLLYMSIRFFRIDPALQTISAQSQQAGITPAIIFTEAWRLKVAAALTELKSVGLEIQQYEPVPPEFKHLDDLIAADGKDLVAFADGYAAGVDTVSSDRLARAGARLQSAKSRSTQITTEIRALAQQYGITIDANGETL